MKSLIFLFFACWLRPLLGLTDGASTPRPSTNNQKVEFWNSGTCPYAQRVWIALVEKGIDFESRIVNLQDKQADFQKVYASANPNPLSSSKVPVLVVTDRETGQVQYFTESKVVLEAIEELWGQHHSLGTTPSLLPKNSVAARAKARMFGDVVYDQAFGSTTRSPYAVAKRKVDAEEGHVGVWDFEAERIGLCESLAALDTSLRAFHPVGPFVLGACFSMAECNVAPFVQRADAILSHYGGLHVMELCKTEGYDRVGTWWKAVLERESVVATGRSAEEYVESAKRVIDMMRARDTK